MIMKKYLFYFLDEMNNFLLLIERAIHNSRISQSYKFTPK